MGGAKDELLRYQEMEPMYDWIEENYGDDAGDEGSESWNKAVQAFHDYCEEQLCLEQEMHWQEEYDYYITLTLQEANNIFEKDLSELETMINSSQISSPTFYKMCYAHVVTILEVYLEDIVKSLIMSSEGFLANTINNVKPFCDETFNLGDVFLENDSLRKDGLRKFALSQLSDTVFHNIPKILQILCGILNRKLKVEIGDICRITTRRHDIVHRNGKNKDGELIEVSLSETKSALETVKKFSENLRSEISTAPPFECKEIHTDSIV